ncbi:UNVERIFIED_CONTAM: Molybdenum cofactor sulfurase [Sesamum radiatum]|uniref:Molybdenum cofactor sulfurase n=1 Tax=Sesamum radiatum TaxID=300843 RepID=A0AAW2KIP9_SESRA
MADDPEKERFLMEFGQDYGYPNAPKNVDEIRATEFKRLNDIVYLDHAGATLYSESQMEDVFKDLNSTLYGNPHSQSNCSLTTGDIVGEARRQTLSFFNASPGEYKCIFTSGATAALKLVGETFPWSSQSTFMYTMENHNSVLGIREYALKEGAAAIAVDIEDGKSAIQIIPHTLQRRGEVGCRKKEQTSDTYNLFAFPSECNFSGLRFDLGLVNAIKENSYEMPRPAPSHSGRWMVLIDAAKGSATSPPDLSKYKADFVVVSFYKLFGYPTGIGALIARNELHKGSNEWHIEVDPSRFRPNLVVSGGKPYIEDGWRSLKIGQTNFTSVGGCNRCQMINMTFTAGTVQRSNEPLATLASYRRLKYQTGSIASRGAGNSGKCRIASQDAYFLSLGRLEDYKHWIANRPESIV